MHHPMLYRSWNEDRFSPPAEICGVCSDFEEGLLVPVSFCPEADARCEEYYAWLNGHGPEPAWINNAGDEPGPDAMTVSFPGGKTDGMLG
jgi:hypothetical protein